MGRLLLLTSLTMVAFASNSVLNRMALADGQIGPAAFGAIRLASGAVALAAIVVISRRSSFPRLSFVGAGALLVYVFGFSYAYLTLDSGIGALILFGGVQITMFSGALLAGEAVPRQRWIGAGIAFSGLIWLLWPVGAARPEPVGSALMAAAALGWGVYSLVGRKSRDPLAATAMNFLAAAPFSIPVLLLIPDSTEMTRDGILLAIISGVVTSGFGYALWYSVLPLLPAARAAVAQLTVPVLAMAGGALLLSEPVTLRFVLSSILVLGGVVVSVRN